LPRLANLISQQFDRYGHEIENFEGFSGIITIALCLTGKLDKNAISEPKTKGLSIEEISALLKNF
jgi:hypothetical protein